MKSFRLYHLCLAVLALLAYLTGESGIVHDWLGYAVAGTLIVRLLLSLSPNRQFGFTRFLPTAAHGVEALKNPNIGKVLLAAVLLSVIIATGTGVAMDKGRALGLADAAIISSAQADESDDNSEKDREDGAEGGEDDESFLYDVHEFSANLMLLFVALHAAWLISFKRPLAFYMLFVPKNRS